MLERELEAFMKNIRCSHSRVSRALCTCLAALVLTSLSIACGPGISNYPYAKEPDPRSQEYVIGVPDRLQVEGWRNPELSTTVQVRPDGTITLPLVGDVAAADKTPSQLKDTVLQRLKEYVKVDDNQVTVTVAAIESYRVTVTGNVGNPGVQQAPRFLTVGEAIALAGGPNRFATPEETELVRTRSDGTVVRIPIRYDLIMAGRAPEQDLVLLRGDLVFVP